MTYSIIRFYMDGARRRTLRKGLTLEEARAHCSDPETSSTTCTNTTGLRRTKVLGQWFDGYESESKSTHHKQGSTT